MTKLDEEELGKLWSEHIKSGQRFKDARDPFPESAGFVSGFKACSSYKQKRIDELSDEVRDTEVELHHQRKRIAELEAEKAGYKKAAVYWRENYDRLIVRPEGGGE